MSWKSTNSQASATNSPSFSSEEKEKKQAWKTIHVPEGLKTKIDELSEKIGEPRWIVIAKGLECYERERTKNWKYRNLSEIDRVSYYIMKLMTSVERFKLNPSEDNLAWLATTVNQIAGRLSIDISYVLNIAKRYMKTKDKDDYVELNMLAKLAISDMIKAKLIDPVLEKES